MCLSEGPNTALWWTGEALSHISFMIDRPDVLAHVFMSFSNTTSHISQLFLDEYPISSPLFQRWAFKAFQRLLVSFSTFPSSYHYIFFLISFSILHIFLLFSKSFSILHIFLLFFTSFSNLRNFLNSSYFSHYFLTSFITLPLYPLKPSLHFILFFLACD